MSLLVWESGDMSAVDRTGVFVEPVKLPALGTRARGRPLRYNERQNDLNPVDMDVPSYAGVNPMVEGVLVRLQDGRSTEPHFSIIDDVDGRSVGVDTDTLEPI